jgi:hypothetical protein
MCGSAAPGEKSKALRRLVRVAGRTRATERSTPGTAFRPQCDRTRGQPAPGALIRIAIPQGCLMTFKPTITRPALPKRRHRKTAERSPEKCRPEFEIRINTRASGVRLLQCSAYTSLLACPSSPWAVSDLVYNGRSMSAQIAT